MFITGAKEFYPRIVVVTSAFVQVSVTFPTEVGRRGCSGVAVTVCEEGEGGGGKRESGEVGEMEKGGVAAVTRRRRGVDDMGSTEKQILNRS